MNNRMRKTKQTQMMITIVYTSVPIDVDATSTDTPWDDAKHASFKTTRSWLKLSHVERILSRELADGARGGMRDRPGQTLDFTAPCRLVGAWRQGGGRGSKLVRHLCRHGRRSRDPVAPREPHPERPRHAFPRIAIGPCGSRTDRL